MRKRLVTLIAVVLFVAGLSSISFAQGRPGMMGNDHTMRKHMMKSDMMAKGEMIEKCPMHGMMMKGMMEKSIIATADGGVIVLAGNKVIKYDKDLNPVKEVEIKVDMEAMKKDMAEMMKNCPMMKGGMMGAGMIGNNTSQNTTPAGVPEEKK
ncbi:MAG: hypothetical protein HQL27_00515 [Candidatus Omnitrophica bacterium]|nr:hypothetical protein [Candidatus Omnitrophota bacterium]